MQVTSKKNDHLKYLKPFLLFIVLSSSQTLLAQCFPEWSHKSTVTINNTLNKDTLTDYNVLVTLNTRLLIKFKEMKKDAGDIRFSDLSCNVLPHYIESGVNTATTKIWVKVPEIPANESIDIWLAYGNPAALNSSNGANTFPFFDDFNIPPINFSSCGDPALNMQKGKLTMSWSSAGLVSIISQTTFPASEVYTGEMKVASTNSSYPAIGWYSTKDGTGYSLFANNNYAAIGKSNTSTGSQYCYPIDFASNNAEASNSRGIWSITWITTQAIVGEFPTIQSPIYSIDGTYKHDHELVLVAGTVGNGPGELALDWVRARKYTNPEPVVSITKN